MRSVNWLKSWFKASHLSRSENELEAYRSTVDRIKAKLANRIYSNESQGSVSYGAIRLILLDLEKAQG